MNSIPLKILYTNWKGQTEIKNIVPQEIYFGTTEQHKEEQWLMQVLDVDKGATRTYAVQDFDFIYGNNDHRKLENIKKEFFK